MRKVAVFILLLIAITGTLLYSLDIERIFPEITGPVHEIKFGDVDNLGEYGYFFVTPDSGLVYYNYSSLPEYHQSILPIISSSCISDYVTDQIYCALGAGSFSDGIYAYDTNTKTFSLKTWLFSPKFVKYLNSGFYVGAIEGLIYSADGNEWSVIEEFSLCEISDAEETADSILFVGAKVPGVSNAVLFMKNGDSIDSLNTGFDEINDIYYRKSGDFEEVLVTLGNGTYSDGLYRILYNDSSINNLELIAYILEPNLITYHNSNYNGYIVTGKNNADMYFIPYYPVISNLAYKIEHELDITMIYCISDQYPVYTPNFLIGTDKGVYFVSGNTGIADSSIPSTDELRQNYPNPFNPSTEISYSLKSEGMVMLSVFNTKGELVSTLVNEEKPAGIHSVNFNSEGLNSGIYFYKLNVDGKSVDSNRMLLMK